MKTYNSDNITPEDTIALCARLTADSICCMFCCGFCGGCCGQHHAFVVDSFPNESIKSIPPGKRRMMTTCCLQSLAGMIMPSTMYGCFWGCCGMCTQCVRHTLQCVVHVEDSEKGLKIHLHQKDELSLSPPKIERMEKNLDSVPKTVTFTD